MDHPAYFIRSHCPSQDSINYEPAGVNYINGVGQASRCGGTNGTTWQIAAPAEGGNLSRPVSGILYVSRVFSSGKNSRSVPTANLPSPKLCSKREPLWHRHGGSQNTDFTLAHVPDNVTALYCFESGEVGRHGSSLHVAFQN